MKTINNKRRQLIKLCLIAKLIRCINRNIKNRKLFIIKFYQCLIDDILEKKLSWQDICFGLNCSNDDAFLFIWFSIIIIILAKKYIYFFSPHIYTFNKFLINIYIYINLITIWEKKSIARTTPTCLVVKTKKVNE